MYMSSQCNLCNRIYGFDLTVTVLQILALLYAERLSNSLDLISDHVMYLVLNSYRICKLYVCQHDNVGSTFNSNV